MLKSQPNLVGNNRYEGFCIDLLKEIASMVGFEYRIELVPDGKYGVIDLDTREWNGIVRQLMDKVMNLIFKVAYKTDTRIFYIILKTKLCIIYFKFIIF